MQLYRVVCAACMRKAKSSFFRKPSAWTACRTTPGILLHSVPLLGNNYTAAAAPARNCPWNSFDKKRRVLSKKFGRINSKFKTLHFPILQIKSLDQRANLFDKKRRFFVKLVSGSVCCPDPTIMKL